jgi:hypothetical protein
MNDAIKWIVGAGLSMLFCAIISPKAHAEPVDLFGIPPLFRASSQQYKVEYREPDEILSSTAIKDGDQTYRLKRYRPRKDISVAESKAWLQEVIADMNARFPKQGFDVKGCKEVKPRHWVCDQIQMRGNGQDIGLLGVVSGISEEI